MVNTVTLIASINDLHFIPKNVYSKQNGKFKLARASLKPYGGWEGQTAKYSVFLKEKINLSSSTQYKFNKHYNYSEALISIK